LPECLAEPGRAKVRAGSSAARDSEGFCSSGIWRCLKCGYGCTGPVGTGQTGGSRHSSAEAGDSHHPWSSHQDAVPAGVGRGGRNRGAAAL